MKDKIIGIDLGTTNSAAAIVGKVGKPEIIPNRNGSNITPSVLYFGDEILIGEEAKEMQALGENNVASFFKRNMGDPNFILNFHDRDYSPTDLSALLLERLKMDSEIALGAKVSRAVITVPAYFNDHQRKATMQAGQQIGLDVIKMINEPTAAALAYGTGKMGNQQSLLIYDLGGGTFDITLVTVDQKRLHVIATDGDHQLGGKDWDDRIVTYLADQFEDEHGTDPLEDTLSANDLAVRCELAKKQLSQKHQTRISITHEGERGNYLLTRKHFEELTRDLMERTQSLCQSVLDKAGIGWSALDGVLLVGGSTRMPMVSEYISAMSGKPPRDGVNVDEAVAHGAAIQAFLESEQASKFFLSGAKAIEDVMSHSLGLLAVDEKRNRYINEIIIPKNKTIPCSFAKPFSYTPSNSDQPTTVDVVMIQGEHQDPMLGTLLGKHIFEVSSNRAPYVLDIEYSYDKNGVVNVHATHKATGIRLHPRVESCSNDMDWLSLPPEKESGLLSPYNKAKGQNRIVGALKDGYGNADGNQYDLARDGAFQGSTIAILHLYTGESFNFKKPLEALKEKGFDIQRWTKPPRVNTLKKKLDKACQLWIISNATCMLTSEHLSVIRNFFNAGKGIYVWGDNDPFFADANQIMNDLFGISMHGNVNGNRIVGLSKGKSRKGFISHLITTGLEHLYEGVTIATIDCHKELTPLLHGSAGNQVVAIYDKDGKRAIFDGGFTRLYCNWDTAGTGRYVKNAAAWLANFERFGDKIRCS